MATEQRSFQLVVFGASGFTGQFVTEEVAREQVDPERSSHLPWAVAGRSREKLLRVLERAALKLGKGRRGRSAFLFPAAAREGPGEQPWGERGVSEVVVAPSRPLRYKLKRKVSLPSHVGMSPLI